MKKIILGVLFVLSSAYSYCQLKSGYDIAVTISGLKDSSIYLAYHFGDKQYLRDTVVLDKRGYGVFHGKEILPQGIYMIVLPGKNYFEILISDDQQFSVSCSYPDYYNSLEFKGSEENSYFIRYQKKWVSMQQDMASINRRIQVNKQNSDSLNILTAKQKKLENEMKTYLNTVMSDNQHNLLSVLVRSMYPVEVPDFTLPSRVHNPDSLKWIMRYYYNKYHFFDNIDLADERLLRTPILQARLDAFFKVFETQPADSINSDIDRILSKCQGSYKVFQYITVYLFNHFRESQIMGHDAVMVKLADDIYLSGKADWVTQQFKDDLRKQVELLRYNLIGLKAQDLVMDSYNGVFVSLYDIEKDFTILYFWEPNCSHCKESTPKLKEYYNKVRESGIEVFAVCTTSDKQAWSKYIVENNLTWINGWDPERKTHYDYYYDVESTPMIYILDRNKKIIAKKLSVEDIPGFIDNYRKFFK